jgi:aspartate/methionine/tyrosine aminotransferase
MINALAKRYGRPRETFMATTGATAGLNLILSSLVGPGDHVLVEAPGFYLLEKLAKAAGATVSKLPRRAPSFDIDVGELSGLLRPDTKAVVITNLHNPTGAWLSHEQLTAVAQTAASVGAVLIVDEVYGDFAREVSKRSAADASDNVLAVSSLTKVFGLYTLKAGWITATPALLAKISANNIEVGYEIGKLSHMVAALVLEAFEPFEAHWKRVISANQAIINRHAARLTAAGLIEGAPPEYGCIYFPKIVGCEDSRPVARLLWREQKLLVAPGEYFNLPGHIRIGYGSADPSAIEDGMSRLSAGLARRAGKAYP